MIPSIEELRQRHAVRLLETKFGREPLVGALRTETDALRVALERGSVDVAGRDDAARLIEERLARRLEADLAPSLRPVINGTGVIIHTNLGRAPLCPAAIARVQAVSAGYSNLEYDLATGTRGRRSMHASALLCRLTGAEAATVVNNNAAAVLLVLTALAAGREVIISRGELVEIGGGFRIPDVLHQSGARLREVGTTNRTRTQDYAAAINDHTALILRVHPSNFRVEGFTERPRLSDVVDMARRFKIPVVEDLGSGNLRERLGVGSHAVVEPTVQASLAAGVSVCTFSGDKLLGGPQAGIIAGERAQVDAVGHHPLMRALRVDKLVYAALEATLLEHVSGRAHTTVPVTRMIDVDVDELSVRAHEIVKHLSASTAVTVTVGDGDSAVGGGTTPGFTIPSCVLDVRVRDATLDTVESWLRASTPPVVGRIDHDRLLLDLRTVTPDQDNALANVLRGLGETKDSQN